MMKGAGIMVSEGIVTRVAKSTMLCPVSSNMFESEVTGVYEVDPLQDPRWDELVQRHAHGSVFHSPRWLEALRTAYGYDPVVISTCAPDETLANGLVFCRVRSWLTGHRMVSVPFSDHCEPLVQSSEALEKILKSLRNQCRDKNCRYLEMRPSNSEAYGGVLPSWQRYYRHSIDLHPGLDVIFSRF